MDLEGALEQFDRVETNLTRLETVWDQLEELVPSGIEFSSGSSEHLQYENLRRAFRDLLAGLPDVDGFRIVAEPMALDEIAQGRLDASEISEPELLIAVGQDRQAPADEIAEYRHRLAKARKALVRKRVQEIMAEVDGLLAELASRTERDAEPMAGDSDWDVLVSDIAEIRRLLGSQLVQKGRWGDLARHLSFGLGVDLRDIAESDWPSVRVDIEASLYGKEEPLPVDMGDLANLAASEPTGPVSTSLEWSNLDDDAFERLIFNLLNGGREYENPRWLMKTRAADRGRDLSVDRVRKDSLAGTSRERVIVQCKHWRSRSVKAEEVADTLAKVQLWEPPRVDLLVIATSGRFTSDAVRWVETHNEKGQTPFIEPWPESHLETLLASRPSLVGEFGLRTQRKDP